MHEMNVKQWPRCVTCGRFFDPTLEVDTVRQPASDSHVPGRCPYCRTSYRAPVDAAGSAAVAPAPTPPTPAPISPAPIPFLSVSAPSETPTD